jgi:hypothetical protein
LYEAYRIDSQQSESDLLIFLDTNAVLKMMTPLNSGIENSSLHLQRKDFATTFTFNNLMSKAKSGDLKGIQLVIVHTVSVELDSIKSRYKTDFYTTYISRYKEEAPIRSMMNDFYTKTIEDEDCYRWLVLLAAHEGEAIVQNKNLAYLTTKVKVQNTRNDGRLLDVVGYYSSQLYNHEKKRASVCLLTNDNNMIRDAKKLNIAVRTIDELDVKIKFAGESWSADTFRTCLDEALSIPPPIVSLLITI